MHVKSFLVWQGAVTYQLGNKSLRWATVFREMERNRDRLGVTDYSVSQTTLEQVSLHTIPMPWLIYIYSHLIPLFVIHFVFRGFEIRCYVSVQVFVNFAKDQAEVEETV